MLEKIINLDQKLLIYLNNLGSTTFDFFWLSVTKQSNWVLFFVFLLYLIYKKFGTKNTLFILLFIALIVAFTDQITNLFKNGFQRLRPCTDSEINQLIRVVKSSETFSFFSGHAANTMAVSVFLYLVLRKKYHYFYLLFLWPLVFAYSRIYLGLHYPIDILAGYLFGFISGGLFYKLYLFFFKKYNSSII